MTEGEFTGYKRAGFPYLTAAKDGQDIYSPDCVPEGFSLIDPDHLTGFKITNLYNHWLQHQKKKMEPFIILKPGPLHQGMVKKSEKSKGKQKEYVHVSTDDEDGGDASDGGEGKKNQSDMEGGEQSDEGDEEVSLPKIGPPRGKKAQVASSSKLQDGPQAAGSSKKAISNIPAAKETLRKKRGRGEVSDGVDEEESHGKLAEKTPEDAKTGVRNDFFPCLRFRVLLYFLRSGSKAMGILPTKNQDWRMWSQVLRRGKRRMRRLRLRKRRKLGIENILG